MRKYILLVNLLILKCYADPLILEENEELQTALKNNSYEPNYISMLLGLFLVVALVYLTGFIYQKLTKIKIKDNIDFENRAEIVSTTSLGQNKNIHVIKINGEYLLIGATQSKISLLKELSIKSVDEDKRITNEKSENSK